MFYLVDDTAPRPPWNKGKLIGQKNPSSSRKSGRFGSGCRWLGMSVDWLCSI
jgi:hypothetical protein